ncbi:MULTISPECIES: HWE histidine kinase domain-containing protein [Sphingomonas]|uniref:HWE histidine kinase domain-containing protein n=1 Tax=Sphingomonas TaxID=13687 RepID=UPI000DD756A2|nr:MULTISPECIES: HWE histidine kinase domain-containing protein [Sphingomonas]
MDRPPLAPTPTRPFDAPPAIRAALDAFVRRLDPDDPILAAFAVSQAPMVVCDACLPDTPIVYVNAAFEALTGYPAAEILGRNCRFMQGPLTDAADVARLRAAVAVGEPIEIDLLNHRRDGTPFWNRLKVTPVRDAEGAPRWFVASQLDVTVERHRLARLQEDRERLTATVARREAALAEREARLALALKAGGLGTWSFDLNTRELVASDSCKALFGRMAERPFTYADLLACIHPEDAGQMRRVLVATIRHGHPCATEFRILTPAGEQRWVGTRAEMQRGPDGAPRMVAGFSTDISDRKFAEEHRAVLARELTHRVKNTLATVGAVVSQTLRDAPSLAEARRSVAGRIASLGAAHELLIQDEIEGATIGDIVARVLAPFIDRDGHRFSAEGPAIRLAPDITLALSMALYELATNAIKYGALSVPQGQVVIRWALCGVGADRYFTFCWIEHDGPAVVPPARTGFGSRMIARVLGPHVRGVPAIAYRPEGVRLEIEAPV